MAKLYASILSRERQFREIRTAKGNSILKTESLVLGVKAGAIP